MHGQDINEAEFKVCTKLDLKMSKNSLFILFFGLSTFVSFTMNNPVLYIGLGGFIIYYYIRILTTNPANILSLFFLANHPVSLSISQINIPLLGATVTLFLYIYAAIISIKRSGLSINRHSYKYLSIFIALGIDYSLSYFRTNINIDGFQQIYMYWGLGVIPLVTIILTLRDLSVLSEVWTTTTTIFLSYLCAFSLLYIFTNNFSERIFGIENPIGLSYFIITNLLLYIYTSREKGIRFVLIVGVTLFQIIVIGQRSFLVAILILGLILFNQYPLKRIYKIYIILMLLSASIYLIGLIPEDAGYKFNFLRQFFISPMDYIKMTISYGAEMHDSLGTIGSRLYFWYVTIVKTNFWIGNGVGDFYTLTGYSYPHNIFAEFYNVFGIGGLLFAILYFGITISNSLRHKSLYNAVGFIPCNLVILFCILQFSSNISGLYMSYVIYYFLATKLIIK